MFNWLSQRFSPRTSRLRSHAPQVAAVARQQPFPQTPAGPDHATVYQQSPWVYVAVNRIAEAGALVPLKVYRLQGERRLEVERHPLEVLLDAPNPRMSRFELFESTLGALELHGNAYWFLRGDSQGRPAEIWPLRPERVSIVPDEQAQIRGYLYSIGGQQIPFEAVEILHFRRWHPGSDYYGLSTLEAARMAIQSDRAMARWNANTFGQDNGIPAGILSLSDYVSDADFERIQREWRSSYGSGQRRTAFLRGGSVAWQNIGLNHSDLDFLQGRRAHRDEILNLFGVPVGLVSENATEANARVAERQFIERTLWPKLVRMAQKISQELLPFYEGDCVAAFEDIRPTDAQARLMEIRSARQVLSINEIRARYYQMAAVAWGEGPSPASDRPASQPAKLPAPDSALRMRRELAQWERFMLNRDASERPERPFVPQSLPAKFCARLEAQLAQAPDAAARRSIFRAARAALEA